MDFSSLPARKRGGAAAIAVRRLEPTAQARSHVAWVEGFAYIWTWPTPEPGLAPDARWIPESLLKARPHLDGPRLLRSLGGVEGQVWAEGRLLASQWWPERPASQEWHRFLRFAGVAAGALHDTPAASELPWQAVPWGDVRRGFSASPASLERAAWTLGLGALALALGWQLALQEQWSSAFAEEQARTHSLRNATARLLSARERANDARASIDAYRRLQWAISDYVLMADIDAALPDEARLVGWQREGVKLKAGVQSQDADPRHYVAAFAQHKVLSQLQVAPAAETGVMGLDFVLPPPPGTNADDSAGGVGPRS